MGAFIGVGLLGWLGTYTDFTEHDGTFLIGSFGATAVLLYGSPSAPFAQPRHVLGGHMIGALIGVACAQFLHVPLWILAAVAVSLTIVLMYLTKTTHPPSGATALTAIIGSHKIHELGFWYMLHPVLEGLLILLLVALIINNLSPHRKYPNYWY
jgi:CBS-domain-containing membrane protein